MFDLAEDWLWLTNLAASCDKRPDASRVTAELLKKDLVPSCSFLNAELLVHFRRVAGHEWLQYYAKSVQGIQSSVDDLFASWLGILSLVEVPRLIILDVLVAVARVVHGNLEAVLQFDSFHVLHI